MTATNEGLDKMNTELRPEPAKTAPALEMSPRERAAARAKALRDNAGGDMDDGTDEFAIDLDIIPDGWSYEWKSWQTFGMDLSSHHVHLARKGWEAVPTSRHPELMPLGTKGSDPIIRKGMLLMERPLEITKEQRELEYRDARRQVRAKEEQLTQAPAGTMDRVTKDHNLVKVKKSYEAMEIPE